MSILRPKLIAFDLDGTLKQHRSPLEEKNRQVLSQLRQRYALVMVGAGACQRIFRQMGEFPIAIIGNYGMQQAEYDEEAAALCLVRSDTVPVDREEVLRRAAEIRQRFNLHDFAGETLEIHPSGMLTFPVLGTQAAIADKLQYDPDKKKRRVMYDDVCKLFFDYHVMIGGSSSFDIVPRQYGKRNALLRYAQEKGLSMQDILYCGDDYRPGGNDYDVYEGGIPFLKVDDYRAFSQVVQNAGLL